jgi:ATP-dependent Clp protease adaptor protein ClpS
VTQIIENPTVPVEDFDTVFDLEDLWAVILWNDEVNTFQHVIKALMEILEHSLERAEHLTLQVHNTGKAVVAVRPKDEALAAVHAFHARGIQATLGQI